MDTENNIIQISNFSIENIEINLNSNSNIKIKTSKTLKKSSVKNKKTFKSASLTFYDNTNGYLICEEYRYKEKKILYHTIGGKVEDYDKDIFCTAVREFIEETNLELHPIINQEKLSKMELVEKIVKMIGESSYYMDICVNKENRYFHRFYLCTINTINDINIKNTMYGLPLYFNGNYKTEINKVLWINDKTKQDYKNNFSWLTKMFFNFVYKNV